MTNKLFPETEDKLVKAAIAMVVGLIAFILACVAMAIFFGVVALGRLVF